jgi:hypothetical protein
MGTQTLPLRDLRLAAGVTLGAAALWPVLPVHPPLACPLRATTGIPCPFCGMTRAVVAAVHGDLGASLRYNPGGILIVVLAIATLLAFRVTRERIRVPTWSVVAGFGALWVYNLALNPTF